MANESNQAPPPASDTKTCPACAETIKAAAVKCRYCGEDLIAFAKARAEAEAEIEKDLFVGRGPVIVSGSPRHPEPRDPGRDPARVLAGERKRRAVTTFVNA